jgi:chromosome segregation ATPase
VAETRIDEETQQLRSSLAASQATLEHESCTLVQLRTELQDAVQKNAEASARTSRFESERDAAKDAAREQEDVIGQTRRKIASLEAERDTQARALQEMSARHETRVGALEAELSTRLQALQGSSSSLTTVVSEKVALEERVATMERERSTAVLEHQRAMASLQAHSQLTSQRVLQLEAEVSVLSDRAETASSCFNRAQEHVQVLEREKATLERDGVRALDCVNELEQRVESLHNASAVSAAATTAAANATLTAATCLTAAKESRLRTSTVTSQFAQSSIETPDQPAASSSRAIADITNRIASPILVSKPAGASPVAPEPRALADPSNAHGSANQLVHQLQREKRTRQALLAKAANRSIAQPVTGYADLGSKIVFAAIEGDAHALEQLFDASGLRTMRVEDSSRFLSSLNSLLPLHRTISGFHFHGVQARLYTHRSS